MTHRTKVAAEQGLLPRLNLWDEFVEHQNSGDTTKGQDANSQTEEAERSDSELGEGKPVEG